MSFDFGLLITLIITALVAIAGWFFTHRFSLNREREAKRREMIVRYLINAWRMLESNAQRDKISNLEIESAIADIQLFGTNNQIELAHKVADNLVNESGANLNDLLETLRSNLRGELKLEAAEKKIRYLRIGKQKENKL